MPRPATLTVAGRHGYNPPTTRMPLARRLPVLAAVSIASSPLALGASLTAQPNTVAEWRAGHEQQIVAAIMTMSR